MNTSIRCTNRIEPSSVLLKVTRVLRFNIQTENGEVPKSLTEGQLYSFLVRTHNDNLDVQNKVIRGRLSHIQYIPTRTISDTMPSITNIILSIDSSTELNSRVDRIKLKNLIDVHDIDYVYPEVPSKPRPIPEDWTTDRAGTRVHKFLSEELNK